MQDIALKKNIHDRITEYNQKKESLPSELEKLKEYHNKFSALCSIRGTYGQENLGLRSPYESVASVNLLRSAWLNIYAYLNIESILTAQETKEKGLSVLCANFLETPPENIYDKVLMNPPFYGKHYVKHVEHALKFLKERGKLYAILPITAKTDHKSLDKYKPRWQELPTGSFKESGTNINTVICMIFK